MSVAWSAEDSPEDTDLILALADSKFVTPVPEMEPLRESWLDLMPVKIIAWAFCAGALVFSLAVVVFSVWLVVQVLSAR